MSKECLNIGEAQDKLDFQPVGKNSMVINKSMCLSFGARSSNLKKYNSSFECPPDDDILPTPNFYVVADPGIQMQDDLLVLRSNWQTSKNDQYLEIEYTPSDLYATTGTLNSRMAIDFNRRDIVTSLRGIGSMSDTVSIFDLKWLSNSCTLYFEVEFLPNFGWEQNYNISLTLSTGSFFSIGLYMNRGK